jgi:hypothetical protein
VALVLLIGAVAYLSERPGAPAPQAPAITSQGTALLGSATCATWQAARSAKRLTIIQTLAVAATQPDPENPGATLAQGAAYGLFERVCSTQASRSVLLYEAYNRAASMSAVRPVGAGWSPAPHP